MVTQFWWLTLSHQVQILWMVTHFWVTTYLCHQTSYSIRGIQISEFESLKWRAAQKERPKMKNLNIIQLSWKSLQKLYEKLLDWNHEDCSKRMSELNCQMVAHFWWLTLSHHFQILWMVAHFWATTYEIWHLLFKHIMLSQQFWSIISIIYWNFGILFQVIDEDGFTY